MFKKLLTFVKDCFSPIDYEKRIKERLTESHYEAIVDAIECADKLLHAEANYAYQKNKTQFYKELCEKLTSGRVSNITDFGNLPSRTGT